LADHAPALENAAAKHKALFTPDEKALGAWPGAPGRISRRPKQESIVA
jgi:hypothetical protein